MSNLVIFDNMLKGCCKTPRYLMSDDGNRSQFCMNCKASWNADKICETPRNARTNTNGMVIYDNMLGHCCENPRHIMTNDGNRNQKCMNCKASWFATKH